MDHKDHVALLRQGVEGAGTLWADFGSGTGAFTLALTDLLGQSAEIYSVDKDQGALRRQQALMQTMFPGVTVHYHQEDFTSSPDLPPLDGIVMANALHFFANKVPVLERIKDALKPGGHFVLVEYNTDRGNRWVPHPLSYPAWAVLAEQSGFADTTLLETRPSNFLGSFYAALSLV